MVAGSEHSVRVELKTASHERQLKAKTGQLQRRSNTGRSRKECPKKGGSGGKTVWGSFKDDIVEFSRS